MLPAAASRCFKSASEHSISAIGSASGRRAAAKARSAITRTELPPEAEVKAASVIWPLYAMRLVEANARVLSCYRRGVGNRCLADHRYRDFETCHWQRGETSGHLRFRMGWLQIDQRGGEQQNDIAAKVQPHFCT